MPNVPREVATPKKNIKPPAQKRTISKANTANAFDMLLEATTEVTALKKQLAQAQGEVGRLRKGLEDIQTHIQLSVKGKYELSIVYQIAGKALVARKGKKND